MSTENERKETEENGMMQGLLEILIEILDHSGEEWVLELLRAALREKERCTMTGRRVD